MKDWIIGALYAVLVTAGLFGLGVLVALGFIYAPGVLAVVVIGVIVLVALVFLTAWFRGQRIQRRNSRKGRRRA